MVTSDQMHSPSRAVYGYDRTYVRRMTLSEYLQELEDEERDVRGEAVQQAAATASLATATTVGVPRQYELRRVALSSPNPAVTFTNKFPTYDRLGRELCVLYQLQEAAVQEELRRLRTANDVAGRRSGVRLSGEVAVTEDCTQYSVLRRSDGNTHATQPGTLPPRTTRRRAQSLPTANDLLCVSDLTSNAASAAAMRATVSLGGEAAGPSELPPSVSRQASVAASEFTIYRDSVLAEKGSARRLLARGAGGVHTVQRAMSTTPPPPSATLQPLSRTHACSAPPCEDKENTRLHAVEGRVSEPASRKRVREMTARADKSSDTNTVLQVQTRAAPHSLPRPSHVHFADTKNRPGQPDVAAPDGSTQTAAAPMHAVLPTTLERQHGQDEEVVTTGQQDPLRFTTVRESALRTTKQLFRGTTTVLPAARATTTLHYAQPIPSAAYGMHAITIPASRISDLVESNLRSLSELGVTSIEDCTSQPCPELQCTEQPVQFGTRLLRLLRFHVVAEVYDAIEEQSGVRGNDSPASAPHHVLVYRWQDHLLPFHGNETRRAALGLMVCAPVVHVTGLVFVDGGVTLCTLPQGYCVVPMSSIPLSLPAYTTLLKLVLKTFSTLVARRTVHGNVTAFGELLLAFAPADGTGDAEHNATTPPPVVLPLHWERMVDFGMFVDRDVGRTVALDAEDSVEPSLLTIGRDLSTLMQCFLKHRISTELSAEQYALLHRLILMATEHTQVANYLVQIKDLMCALPTDLPALRHACSSALAAQQPKPL